MLVQTILIILIFASIIVISIVLIVAIRNYILYKDSPANNNQKPQCKGDDLYIITNNPECIRNNNPTNQYYIEELGYLVGTFPSSALSVCVQLCPSYVDGKCIGNEDNFEKCMSKINPDNCSGINPLAIKQNVLYYANSPSCQSCDNCPNSAN